MCMLRFLKYQKHVFFTNLRGGKNPLHPLTMNLLGLATFTYIIQMFG